MYNFDNLVAILDFSKNNHKHLSNTFHKDVRLHICICTETKNHISIAKTIRTNENYIYLFVAAAIWVFVIFILLLSSNLGKLYFPENNIQ